MRGKKGKDAVLPKAPSFTFGYSHSGKQQSASHIPGPGQYSPEIALHHNSKYSRSPAAGFGERPASLSPTGANPGPGAYVLPVRPASPGRSAPVYTFHGVEDSSSSRRSAAVPGPGHYTPNDEVVRPSSRAAAMHTLLPPAFLPRVGDCPSPTSYSPTQTGSGLRHGPSFKGTGHMLGAPAATVRSPAPGAYSPHSDVGKLRSASYTFGVRPFVSNPMTALPGPGAYDLE